MTDWSIGVLFRRLLLLMRLWFRSYVGLLRILDVFWTRCGLGCERLDGASGSERCLGIFVL